jgi:hypothetical protein
MGICRGETGSVMLCLGIHCATIANCRRCRSGAAIFGCVDFYQMIQRLWCKPFYAKTYGIAYHWRHVQRRSQTRLQPEPCRQAAAVPYQPKTG